MRAMDRRPPTHHHTVTGRRIFSFLNMGVELEVMIAVILSVLVGRVHPHLRHGFTGLSTAIQRLYYGLSLGT
jgi:hypothetical protein